jgi:hypothetical protein
MDHRLTLQDCRIAGLQKVKASLVQSFLQFCNPAILQFLSVRSPSWRPR